MSIELNDDEHAVLSDLFEAAARAYETHSIPAGDYTTRTERLALELKSLIAARLS